MVGYDPDSYTVSESEGNVTLTIRVFSHSGVSPRPFTLAITTTDDTAGMLSHCLVDINYMCHCLQWL